MITSRRAAAVTAVLAAGMLLAGCGSAGAPRSTTTGASITAAATPDPARPPASTTHAPTPPPRPTTANTDTATLPWPASGAAEAAALQSEVDRGSQPWLLDPTEVALSYVAAAHDWTTAEATVTGSAGGRTTVEVREGTRLLTLTLSQPSKPGNGGIWVVTAERSA
ncbi:acyl transferase [Actinomycetes bacterium KLBMP 9759]